MNEWRWKCKKMTNLGSLSCDQSSALKQLGRTSEAMAASTAGIFLDRSNSKAWISRCDLMEIISGPERALMFLQTLREDWSQDKPTSGSSFLRRCSLRIDELERKMAHRPNVKEVGHRSTEEQLKDRGSREFQEEKQDLASYIATMEMLVPQCKLPITREIRRSTP